LFFFYYGFFDDFYDKDNNNHSYQNDTNLGNKVYDDYANQGNTMVHYDTNYYDVYGHLDDDIHGYHVYDHRDDTNYYDVYGHLDDHRDDDPHGYDDRRDNHLYLYNYLVPDDYNIHYVNYDKDKIYGDNMNF